MRAWLLLLLLILGTPTWAQTAQDVFDRWLQDPRLQPAHVGFLLVRLHDAKVLASHDADKLFVPASTAKVMTARAILDADLRQPLRTRVWKRWRNQDELVLWGGADPELSTAQLGQLAQAVKDQGVRRVLRIMVGSLETNATAPLGRGWAWDDATDDYSAEISGLTVDRGTVLLKVRPARVGDAPEVVVPDGFEPVMVKAVTIAGEGEWGLARLPGRSGTLLWGTVPAGEPLEVRMAVAEPERVTGLLFAEALRQRGVEVGEVVSYQVKDESDVQELQAAVEEDRVLASVQSRPIEAMLREALARSDNLAMELLLRAATGKSAPGSPPTARLVDGSGLSRYNLLSPRHLVQTLQRSAQLRDLLPLAGVEGTLKRRLKDGLAYRQVRAKTGTVSTVSGLTGTLFPDDPQKACVFALLTNGYTRPGSELKQAEDALVEELVHRLGYPYLP